MKLKAVSDARHALSALQAELMALTHIGSTVTALKTAELALEGDKPTDQIQATLQEILDKCPKFEPDNEIEPTRNGDEELSLGTGGY